MLSSHDERPGLGGRHEQFPRQHPHHPHQDRHPYPHHQDREHARHDRQRYHQARYGDRAHRSGPVQWCVAVVFTALAIAVLLGAVAVLIVVLLLQPRPPYLAVRSARLDALVYDQRGALDDVQLSVLVEARNGNARSAAAFSDLELRLAFGGAVLAKLRADPFRVPASGALPLAYVARARGAPLDEPASSAMEAAIQAGVVPFQVDGKARTRWKLAPLVTVRQWTRLACQIRFEWPNVTALDFSCKSKSKSWFY